MTTQPAPLLTASWADCLLGYIRKSSNDNGGKKADAMLQALADGRTACVRVMSEDECRAEFEAWAVNNNMRNFSRREEDGEYCNGPAQAFWGVWLACARAMGAVR